MTTYTNDGVQFYATYYMDETLGLNSSVFSRVGYNEKDKQLLVTFKDTGRDVIYNDFQPDAWQQFATSGSLGSYYNSYIRNYYSGSYEDSVLVYPNLTKLDSVEWTSTGDKMPEQLSVAPGFYSVVTDEEDLYFSSRKALIEWFSNQDFTDLDISITFTQFHDKD